MWKILYSILWLFSVAIPVNAWSCLMIDKNLTLSNLPRGSYNVGFRTIDSYDATRPPLREQLKLPGDQQHGRAIQINIWYPAEKSKVKLKLSHYLSLAINEIDFKSNSFSTDSIVEAVRREQWLSHEIEINKDALRKLLLADVQMEASLNAEPVQGKYPIIFIGPEAAFKWCIIAEFLASYGYVVVCIPNLGFEEKNQDFNKTLFVSQYFIQATESGIADLRHTVSVVRNLKFVNPDLIGILGYSGGVTTAMGLIMSGVNAKAIVSLEGAIGGYYGPKVLSMTHAYNPHRITMPILHIFSPSYGYNHAWLNDEFNFSDRTILATYPIRHEDFTSYGALETFSPGISGKAKQPPALAFEVGALYTLHFFEANIRGSNSSKGFISNSLEKNRLPESLQENVPAEWRGIKRIAASPSLGEYELELIYKRNGFDKLISIYDSLRIRLKQPISQKTFYNIGLRLTTHQEKRGWYKRYTESFPHSPESNYLFALSAERFGDKKEAAIYFDKAYELLRADSSIVLRNIYLRIIDQKIQTLKKD